MRLIDADALDSVVFRLNTEENAQITRLEYKLIDNVIFEFPTIDAVPVIRCKDCKWFGKSGCAILIVDESDKPKEDDFCSWAERKEE